MLLNVIICYYMLLYRIHWNKRPWAFKFQRHFLGSQAPMGAYLGGHLIRVIFCVPGERQMK